MDRAKAMTARERPAPPPIPAAGSTPETPEEDVDELASSDLREEAPDLEVPRENGTSAPSKRTKRRRPEMNGSGVPGFLHNGEDPIAVDDAKPSEALLVDPGAPLELAAPLPSAQKPPPKEEPVETPRPRTTRKSASWPSVLGWFVGLSLLAAALVFAGTRGWKRYQDTRPVVVVQPSRPATVHRLPAGAPIVSTPEMTVRFSDPTPARR